MNAKNLILLILLLVSSAIRAKVTYIWLPDPVLVFLLPLILHISDGYVGPISLTAGILRDGLYLDIPWVSPFLFTFFGVIALIYRNFVNIALIPPKIILFTVSIVVYYAVYLYVNGLALTPLYFRAILLTVVLAVVVELWVQKK